MREYKIAAIPGDGIGTEVIAAGLKALQVLAGRDGGFRLTSSIFRGAATTTKSTVTTFPPEGSTG